MPLFADLLNKLPKSKETRMSAQGYALWISWQNTLDPNVTQTLQNYGGMFLVSDQEQSLWFFFNQDVFLALARLCVSARFNPITASLQLLSASFQLGVKREIGLEIEDSLKNQNVPLTGGLELWIHPSARQKSANTPGISFLQASPKEGMSDDKWTILEADTRLPYTSSQGWYAILRPLGNPLDKDYQHSWPHMQQAIANNLKENKLKFLVQDDFIMVLVDSLLVLRTWLHQQLSHNLNIKETDRDHFWPYVCAIVERKGLNFNSDLYKKVNLQWSKLTPDFPYLSYRTAYLLGEGFSIQDIGFSDTESNMDSWCTVMLNEGDVDVHSISVLMPSQFVNGDGENCFFCGINTHTALHCPTRSISPNVGQSTSIGPSLDEINESYKTIEKTLSAQGLEGYTEILQKNNSASSLLMSLFEINFASQMRAITYFWINKGRDIGKLREETTYARDESPAWEYLDKLQKTTGEDLSSLDKDIQAAIVRAPRDTRLRTIQGFLYIFRQDYPRALAAFKEAAALTPLPSLQAWNEYLQARIEEIQGNYVNAMAQYDQVLRVIPLWRDVEYRKVVCKIKLGFAEQALSQITKIIQDDPSFFNRCLMDPELGRGHLAILTHLYPLWQSAAQIAQKEKASIARLKERVTSWFPPTHPSFIILSTTISDIEKLAETQNYAAFLELAKRRPACQKEIDEFIKRQIDELQARYKHYLDDLQVIRDEASWFPFPKILREFSADFNHAASIINWAFASNFNEAENFNQAQKNTEEIETLLRKLHRKLKLLRTVRDSTLFGLTLAKTFFWIEAVGLTLCFFGIPAIVYFGDSIGLNWLKQILASQQWEIQKILFGIITVVSLAIAALRATIIFDKQKEKLLNDAREQRERLQNERLERIKKKQQIEADKRKKELQREKEKQQRLRMSE